MPSNASLQRIGVLLAAGRGRRMGGGKQLHPWPTKAGELPLVAAAFDAVADVCDAMIVVVGHRAPEVAAALTPRRFECVSAHPDEPMIASVKAGIARAQQLAPGAALLVHPADHPEVAPATLSKLVAAAAEHPQRAILPEYLGRGGHPVLVPATIVTKLVDADCLDGLRGYWRDHPHCVMRLPVDDNSTVRDIDVPADCGVNR